MKLSQFVIRISEPGDFRGHDFSLITDDYLDVYARVAELGAGSKTAEQIGTWAQKAKWGHIWGPMTVGEAEIELTVKCHEPDREKLILRKKRGRPKKREE